MTFSFGGTDLERYMSVSAATRTVAPGRRVERTAVPGMDGELARCGGMEAQEVTVTGYLRAWTLAEVADARRLLARALTSDGPQMLRLPDEPWSGLMAVYEGGAELSRNAHRPKVELRFLCADPVAYGRDRSAKVSGSATVEVGGTYPARPKVTVKPPRGSSWRITNVDTGEFVCVQASFTGSQTVVIDMASHRCTVNGADHAVTLDSDFFSIDGTQHLLASGGTATLEWAERWL